MKLEEQIEIDVKLNFQQPIGSMADIARATTIAVIIDGKTTVLKDRAQRLPEDVLQEALAVERGEA